MYIISDNAKDIAEVNTHKAKLEFNCNNNFLPSSELNKTLNLSVCINVSKNKYAVNNKENNAGIIINAISIILINRLNELHCLQIAQNNITMLNKQGIAISFKQSIKE